MRVYSRQLNDVTAAVPEIVEAVREMPGKELILDGEVLSLQENGRPQPFQVTMRRFGRKLDVERLRAEQRLHPFWFDLMYLNGGSLMERRRRVDLQRFARARGRCRPWYRMRWSNNPEAAAEFPSGGDSSRA